MLEDPVHWLRPQPDDDRDPSNGTDGSVRSDVAALDQLCIDVANQWDRRSADARVGRVADAHGIAAEAHAPEQLPNEPSAEFDDVGFQIRGGRCNGSGDNGYPQLSSEHQFPWKCRFEKWHFG